MKTKALAIVLAICMVLSMLPVTAFAAQPGEQLSVLTVPDTVGKLEAAAIEPNAKSYSVNLSGGSNGETELLVSSPCQAGSEVFFVANPDDGYLAKIHFSGLEAEDFVYIGMDIWGFIMPGNKVTLEVSYVEAEGSANAITVRASEGGQYVLERDSAKRYESVLLGVLPNDGVDFDPATDVSYSNGDLYYLMEDEDGIHYYELVMGSYDVDIEIRFGDYKILRYVELVSPPAAAGTASVSKTEVYPGEEFIVTAVPNYGFKLREVSAAIGGNSNQVPFTAIGNNQYKAVMPDADIRVYVSFEAVFYRTQVNVVGGVGGTARLNRADTQPGTTLTLTCVPDDNYRVYSVTGVDGIVDKGNNVYEFVMPERDVTINVTFRKIYNPVSLTVDTGIGGTAFTDVAQAKLGDTVTLTCAPEEGYRVAQITGVAGLVDNGDNTYTFTMPDEAVELHVLFLRENNPFLDVNETHFFHDSVLWAVEKGITNGIDDTHFGPFAVCNRAQVVTFLWRSAGSPEPTITENPFTDVPAESWYTKAVLWALENGITTGATETLFDPNGVCMRAHVVTFLWRAKGCPEPVTTVNPFEDVNETDFYYKAVLWALENGVTTGADATHFNPLGQCQRAQVVTFLHRADGIPMSYELHWVINGFQDTPSDYGTVTLSHTKAQAGETITATVVPAEGYVLDWAKCEFGTPVAQVSDTEYTFVMPDHEEIFHVNFSEAPVEPEPTDPVDPEPTDPTDPVDPEPTNPTEPEVPTDPTDPVDPEPTDPTEPEEPTKPVKTYELDLKDNGCGSVSYVDGKTEAAVGESIFFYAIPDEGYYLDHVSIFNPTNTIDVSAIRIIEHGDDLYELIMIPHDLIMTCYFYPIA